MSRPRTLGWLLALVTILIYLPATRNGFVNYDDGLFVLQNPMVQKGLNWQGFQWSFTHTIACNWHPLTCLSHMADCELFHLNAGGHHLVSVLIHAANAVLLFSLLRRLTRFLWPSIFVAALFAWHPLHVESVAWVAERKDVLSTFFALLALIAYAHYVEASQARNTKSKIYFALSLLAFALGLMSKPMLVTLPFVMLLLDFWPLGRVAGCGLKIAGSDSSNLQPSTFNLQLVLEKWPFFILTAAACFVTVIAQKSQAMVPLYQVSTGLRLENVACAYTGYLLKTVWPLHLAVFYPLPKHIAPATFFGAAFFLAVISITVWTQRRQRPYLLMGWLWYLGTLVPVIGLVQVGDQALADRYSYFPLIGIFLAAAFLIKDLAAEFQLAPRWMAMSAIAVLGGCLLLTAKQLSYWRDSETLFTHALAVTGDSALAHLNLGAAYEEQNRTAEAMNEYQEVIRLDPGRTTAYSNMGRLLVGEGKLDEALEYSRAAMLMEPQTPALHDGLGVVLGALGHSAQALHEFDEALRLDPDYGAAHYQKGRLLLKQGDDLAAVNELDRAVQLTPDNFQILIYSARVFAAAENPQVRSGAKALACAVKAANLSSTPSPVMLDTLAMALAETGQFGEAAKIAGQAVELSRAHGETADTVALQERLELYKKNLPWRESFRPPPAN